MGVFKILKEQKALILQDTLCLWQMQIIGDVNHCWKKVNTKELGINFF